MIGSAFVPEGLSRSAASCRYSDSVSIRSVLARVAALLSSARRWVMTFCCSESGTSAFCSRYCCSVGYASGSVPDWLV